MSPALWKAGQYNMIQQIFGSHETLQLPSGKLVKMKDVAFVNHLAKLREKHHEHFWPVVDEVIKWWKTKDPKRWKSYILEVKEIRETRANPKFADNKKASIRLMIDVPQQIVLVLRKLYSVEELDMNKEFWLEFGKRYPMFKVPERL